MPNYSGSFSRLSGKLSLVGTHCFKTTATILLEVMYHLVLRKEEILVRVQQLVLDHVPTCDAFVIVG
jgi:hypothetical protein